MSAPATRAGVLEPLRTRVADALLTRVAGDDPYARRDRIHGTPGPRWFPPGAPIRRVHGDASMFIGGLRALLLQSLHPQAMAAVAQHSGYQGDPWGRLARTSGFIAVTTFGTTEHAAEAVTVVRAVHARVRGTTSDGVPYAASDPHLLSWVHAAEIDSFLAAHQRYGARPLDRAECDEYVEQAAVIARALGAVDVPTTVAQLRDQLQAFRPELRSTPEAREAAHFVVARPPIPWAARVPYGVLAAAGVGLLPRWTRRPLGLPDRPLLDRTAGVAGGRVITSLVRWALPPSG